VEKFAENKQDRTYLFMMNGRSEGKTAQEIAQFTLNIMVIYVEDDQLKCSPFGFVDGEPRDPDSVLTYTGVNPLEVAEWQHISCVFLRQKYVKGQYLALSLDAEDADLSKSDFREKTLRPQTFSRNVYKKTFSEEVLILN
jgi:hypothetical protein